MKRSVLTGFACFLLLFMGTTVEAAPFDLLEGEWIGDFPDSPPEVGEAFMHLNFVDEDTLIVSIIFDGIKQDKQVRYEATDTDITIYYEDDSTDGDTATWEINGDGCLVIVAEGEEAIVLSRSEATGVSKRGRGGSVATLWMFGACSI